MSIPDVHRSIDPATRIGQVSLFVTDLARSIDFYTTGIGLVLLDQHGDTATLGVGTTPLLRLAEIPDGRPWPGRATGLYHFAILVPSRADLGRWLRHWVETGNQMPAQGDHGVSEALYLADPDGNGIEIYRDRPRSEWLIERGRVVMGADPVDVRGVVEAGDRSGIAWSGMPAGTVIGHVHLQVSDIPVSRRFYENVLGFDLMAEMPSALFFSAGGYHHHLGLNIWQSRGAKPASPEYARLQSFEIVVPSRRVLDVLAQRFAEYEIAMEPGDDRLAVLDPSQIRIEFCLPPVSASDGETPDQDRDSGNRPGFSNA